MLHLSHHCLFQRCIRPTVAANKKKLRNFSLFGRLCTSELSRGFAGQFGVWLGGRRCSARGCPSRRGGDGCQQLFRAGVIPLICFDMTLVAYVHYQQPS